MLTVRDHARIQLAADLRGKWLQRAGRVRYELGESETMFAAAVNRLIDEPEAVAAWPVETARLRRLRDARKAARSVDVSTPDPHRLTSRGAVRAPS